MKKKIDLFWYWFIFVVAFVLCFFAINDKKVNAYHFNDEGDIVSDNLFNFDTMATCNGHKWNVNCSINYNELSITSSATTSQYEYSRFVVFTSNIMSFLQNNTIYTFSVNYTGDYLRLSVFNSAYNVILHGSNGNNYVTFDTKDNTDIRIGLYILGDANASATITDLQLEKGNVATAYEPYGIWYSESNYNNAIEESYQNGYDDGYVANNSVPTIFASGTLLYNAISPDGSMFITQVSLSDYMLTYNATLDFTKFLNSSFGNSVPTQTMNAFIGLQTEFNSTDTITISFNNLSNVPEFVENFSLIFSNGDISTCTGSSVSTCVVITYDDIVSNDYSVVLNEINPNLSVSTFNVIYMPYYYDGYFLYGVKSILNDTLYGDGNSTQYDIGYNVGYIVGVSDGKVDGETIGYNKGYTDGYRTASQVVSDPGNNTLVGMVSVLMGMPVNMLVSIYDFDFLGINLAEFFFSLITLLVSIWLIKKLL